MNNKPEVTMQQFLIWSAIVMVLIIAMFCGVALILSSTGGSVSEIPGRIWSWLFVDDVWFIPSVVLTITFVYIWLKTYLPIWAKADRYYFTSVDEEKKEIKVVSLAGKVEGFLGPDYNYKRGNFEEGKNTDYRSFFLYRHFGVIWIGYGCKITKIIPIWNDVTYVIKEAETKGMPAINLSVRLNTRTKDASYSMGYSNLATAMEEDTVELCNNFIKANHIDDILKSKFVINMSKDDVETDLGKIAVSMRDILDKKDGQELLIMSIGNFEICDPEVKKAMESEELQQKRNLQQRLEAEGKATVAKIKAEEEAAVGLVKASAELAAEKISAAKEGIKNAIENAKLQKEAEILGKNGAAELEKSRAWASAIHGSSVSVISFGDSPFLINGEGKAKK